MFTDQQCNMWFCWLLCLLVVLHGRKINMTLLHKSLGRSDSVDVRPTLVSPTLNIALDTWGYRYVMMVI